LKEDTKENGCIYKKATKEIFRLGVVAHVYNPRRDPPKTEGLRV
jgi:hypothetical protein